MFKQNQCGVKKQMHLYLAKISGNALPAFYFNLLQVQMRVQKNTNPLRRTPGANASNRKSQNKGKYFLFHTF